MTVSNMIINRLLAPDSSTAREQLETVPGRMPGLEQPEPRDCSNLIKVPLELRCISPVQFSPILVRVATCLSPRYTGSFACKGAK